MPRVQAVVRFPATGELREISTLTVAIDDVSRADAAAVRVASTQLGELTIPADGAEVAVDLDVDDPVESLSDRRRTYTVSAHASQSGGERFAPGDFLTTTHNPVSLTGDEQVEVPLTYLGDVDSGATDG